MFTLQEFKEGIQNLPHCNKHPWTVHPNHIHLLQECIVQKTDISECKTDTILTEMELGIPIDPSIELINHSNSVLIWDMDLVYSYIWNCPVFYFRVTDPTGTPLTWAHIQQLFPVEGRGVIVSQEEHPMKMVPYLYFHPCQSNNILIGEGKDKLVMLLSLIQSCLHLNLLCKDCASNNQLP
ncbi:hypothetical protein BC833DRAFT_584991 [Globomyces pollinis-pini]|nr:hypothetical protein BC833DRAFT_584991 [Globomyces pollinis-pini]